MDNNFVALNIIEHDNITLFAQPIIYFWDGKSSLDESLHEERFKQFISSKITPSNFYNTTIHMVYVYTDDEDNISHNINKFHLSDIYNVNDFDLSRKYLWEIMNYLYMCAFKQEYDKMFDFKTIYESLLAKYPKKISPNVIANFIESYLSDKYPNMKKSDIELIKDKLYNEIQK